jgi:glutaredoxin 3
MGSSESAPQVDNTADIDNIVKTNDVVIFSSTTCPYCSMAQKALAEVNVDFKVINATNSQLKSLYKLTGMASVPNIWVKGKFVGGCNDGPEPWMGIKPLIRNGELFKMLGRLQK